MSRLSRYVVELPTGGTAVLNLTPEDAKKRGAKPLEAKARPPAKSRVRTSAKK